MLMGFSRFPVPFFFSEFLNPNLLFLAFLVFLAFFLFKEFLAIWSVFPSFPRILGVRQAEEILAFLVVFLAVFQKL